MTDNDDNYESNFKASVKLMENTRSVSNYLFDYYEHVDKEDFNKQFILNFYYVVSELIGNADDISVDDAIDMICDVSLSFLFNIAIIFKAFHTANEDSYNAVMGGLKPIIMNKLNNSNSFFESWGDNE